MSAVVDHLVVGSADLQLGISWIAARLGVAPIPGGVHDGFGTCNALVGLGDQYLEVLALDPEQAGTSSPMSTRVSTLTAPALITVAIAKTDLTHPVPMSRVLPDGVRLEWEVEFTATPLFFIDWKHTPRPSRLPNGGTISSLSITTPEPAMLKGVPGITVREGIWDIQASINGRLLV